MFTSISIHIFVYKIHHSTTITRHHEQQNLISSHPIPHYTHAILKKNLLFLFFLHTFSILFHFLDFLYNPISSLLPPSFIYFVFISWWYNINFNKNYKQKKIIFSYFIRNTIEFHLKVDMCNIFTYLLAWWML